MITFETPKELLSILSSFKRVPGFATIESRTEKKTLVKSRLDKSIKVGDVFEGKIYTTKKEYVRILDNYTTAVNNQRGREGVEGTFVSFPLPFGKWVEGYENLAYYYDKTDNYYFRYYQDRNQNYRYSKYTWHYADGTLLTDAEVKRYWNEFTSPKKESGRQKVSKPVKPRGVMFQNIIRLVADGKVIVRKGFEDNEKHNSILDWHNIK